jgi:glucosyl-3-phosphoglycerate synthase
MADFHQEKLITTLHGLYEAFDRKAYLENLERRLERHSQQHKICLLLPSLYSELEKPEVIGNIVEKIQEVKYLHCIVVSLAQAPETEQFKHTLEYFDRLKTSSCDVKVVWLDGPRVKKIFDEIKERQVPIGVQGKGQGVWMALGYILSRRDCNVVALHDCDIMTYDRILLGRLIEPVANPNNDFEFCKGYYARISPTEMTIKGRVTRLFVLPFIDAMVTLMYEQRHLELARFFSYHKSFKYPLAGEFSLTTHLVRGINISYDWGLEVATLSQVYDQLIGRKIAQIDLAPNYEHKHQELSVEDERRGLHRMVVDIAKFYMTYMRSHGIPLDDAFVDMMLHTYYQNTLRFIRKYSYDAEVNGLKYDLYNEESIARFFRELLWTAWQQSKGPHEARLIPSWNRILYSIPGIYTALFEAVEADNS